MRRADEVADAIIQDVHEILQRRHWDRERVPLDDVITRGTENEAMEYAEYNLNKQMEERDTLSAQSKEKARRDALGTDVVTAPGGPAPRAEASKPLQFKSADIPKPVTLTFDCEYKIWIDEKTKLRNY